MAFCENCGRPLAEGEVCNCTQGQTGNMPNQPGNAGTAKKGKKGLLIAILVLIVAVAGGVAIILNLTNSYKKPVDKIVSLANKRTTKLDSIASAVLPDFAMSSYKKAVKILKSSDDFAEAFDSAEESISELYDEFDDEYDDGWKVKFDCADKESSILTSLRMQITNTQHSTAVILNQYAMILRITISMTTKTSLIHLESPSQRQRIYARLQ